MRACSYCATVKSPQAHVVWPGQARPSGPPLRPERKQADLALLLKMLIQLLIFRIQPLDFGKQHRA